MVRILRVLVGVGAFCACTPHAYAPWPPEPVPAPAPVVRTSLPRDVPEPPELPPQRFEPPQHDPRVAARVPPPPRLDELPALSTRGRCVTAGAVPEPKPRPTVPRPVAPYQQQGTSGDAPRHGAAPAGASSKARADVTASRSAASTPAAEPAGRTAPAEHAPPAAAPGSEAESLAYAADGAGFDDEVARSRRTRPAKRERRERAVPLAPAPEPPPPEPMLPEWPPAHEGWGAATFLSNDDSMSLSSPQRVTYAIEHDLPVPREHVRKHEFLQAFTFEAAPVQPGRTFSVLAQLSPSQRKDSTHTLALAARSRAAGHGGRRNLALTLVLDRSGSMRADGRMELLQQGLRRMLAELRPGDLLNVVTFDHRVCVPLQNFVVGRDDPRVLERTIAALRPGGYTNLDAGLRRGYALADASYRPEYGNRVLLVTDALANTGDTNPATLALVADHYDARRIRLSGIGVGREFNDALLDELTEKGRGAYLFLGSAAEVETIFGRRFTSLVETVAEDVHFRLRLPVTLRMAGFHGEEASVSRAAVQAVHVFADTTQLFLVELEAWKDQPRPQDGIVLEIDYLDPETGAPVMESYAIGLNEMGVDDRNVRKGEVLVHFVEALASEAPAIPTSHASARPRESGRCTDVRRELQVLASGLYDPEVDRILRLWDRYCARYPAARPNRKGHGPS